MKGLYLIGGGGHCRSCIDVIEKEGIYKILGIFDVPEKVGQSILGYKIIDADSNIDKYADSGNYFLVTVGQIKTPEIRKRLFRKNLKFATVISPLAHVSRHAFIDEGSIVMHGAIINASAIVGKNCIINSLALVEHDSRIGDHCHISTAAVINGGCDIGEGSFIGSNAVLKQGRKIPSNSVIPFGDKV